MISIFATACTILSQTACRDVELIYDPSSVSMMTLMVCAQPELAKWLEAHPGYYIKRWSVGSTGRYAKV